MPQEPERPIEKILRDSARERREQAGNSWELHPANRRLLQEEVARQFQKGQKAARGGLLNWISVYWRVTALGGVAALALLLGAVWLVSPQRGTGTNSTLLARNEQTPVPALNDKLSSREQEAVDEKERSQQASDARKVMKKEEAPTFTRRDSPKKDLALDSAPALEKTKPEGVSGPPGEERGIAPALAAADPGSPAAAASAESFRQRYGLSGGVQPQAAPPPGAAPVASPLQGAGPQQASPEPQAFSAAVGQSAAPATSTAPPATASASVSGAVENTVVQYGYFTGRKILGRQTETLSQANQIAPSSSSNKQADVGGVVASPPVLAYFHIEQAGPELRVIDNDGSIYSGSVQAGVATAAGLSSGVEELSTGSRAFGGANQQDNLVRSAAPKRTQAYNVAGVYSFQVEGTNRTSRQRVAFSGLITGLTNPASNLQLRNEPAAVLDAEQTRVAAKSSTTHLSESLGAPNAHVSGKALIGTDQVDIEATAAAPPR